MIVNPHVMNPWIWDHPGPYQIGDRVSIPFGSETVEATVVEDRGNLGGGGKRLYGVRFRVDDVSDEIYTEMDVDQLTLVSRAPSAEKKKKKSGTKKKKGPQE